MSNKIEQISNLFGSKTRYKILKLYAENGNSKFFVREITRLIDEQINSVRRELENLEKIGFLISKDKNNKRYFSVDAKNSVYQGLCVMMGLDRSQQLTHGNSKPSRTPLEKIGEMVKLKQLCSNLLVKPVKNRKMPVDIFCVVSGPSDKIGALEILNKIENQLDYDIKYSVLTNDEYELGAKLNPQLYGTIHEVGIKLA